MHCWNQESHKNWQVWYQICIEVIFSPKSCLSFEKPFHFETQAVVAQFVRLYRLPTGFFCWGNGENGGKTGSDGILQSQTASHGSTNGLPQHDVQRGETTKYHLWTKSFTSPCSFLALLFWGCYHTWFVITLVQWFGSHRGQTYFSSKGCESIPILMGPLLGMYQYYFHIFPHIYMSTCFQGPRM